MAIVVLAATLGTSGAITASHRARASREMIVEISMESHISQRLHDHSFHEAADQPDESTKWMAD